MDFTLSSMSPAPDFLSKFQIPRPPAITALVAEEATLFDREYVPSEYDVVCGRGKGVYNRPGNKRFRRIVQTYVDEYISMKSKVDKSQLLSRIIDKVRAQNNGTAAFIKQNKDGIWFDIGDEQAREKVGHAIREATGQRDASSTNHVAKQDSIQADESSSLGKQAPAPIFQDMDQPKNRRQAKAAIRRQILADGRADG